MADSLVPQGNPCFRFVVISDTHINQSEDHASSFFQLNRLANSRARLAFSQVAAVQPAFVIHVGDIVHPLPSHPGFGQAAENYREMVRDISCPIFLTPGNHDIGDKPWPLAPVAQIDNHAMRAYEKEFGDQWYTWSHANCSFFVINTSLLNSGLPEEEAQKNWFEHVLSTDKNRKFLSLHYPPYVTDTNERSHYDNIDEPARSWLLRLIQQYNMEAVFCGHVHNLWYDQLGETEFYLLPSTAFVRQDYSEMQRVCPPGDEGGRQDIEKLGFFIVDVYEQGHVASFVRTLATTDFEISNPIRSDTPILHSKTAPLKNLGFDFCYPWADLVTIQPSGALDAFDPKLIRNDYPLFALFELASNLVRIPLSDLDSNNNVVRLKKLVKIGINAQIYTPKLPSEAQTSILKELDQGFEAIELIGSEPQLLSSVDEIKNFRTLFPQCKIIISKLRGPQDAAIDGLHYGHLVFHGWVPAESPKVSDLISCTLSEIENVGALYRVRFTESPIDYARRTQDDASISAIKKTLLLRLATDNPAASQDDEIALSLFAMEAAIAAWIYPDIRFVIEGLIDFDRGYFLRKGLFDRSFNPRQAALIYKNTISVLSTYQRDFTLHLIDENDGLKTIEIRNASTTLRFIFAKPNRQPDINSCIASTLLTPTACWDLNTGSSQNAIKIQLKDATECLVYCCEV